MILYSSNASANRQNSHAQHSSRGRSTSSTSNTQYDNATLTPYGTIKQTGITLYRSDADAETPTEISMKRGKIISAPWTTNVWLKAEDRQQWTQHKNIQCIV